MTMRALFLLSLLLTFAAVTPAATPEASEREHFNAALDRHKRNLAEVLSKSNDPRELFVAARLMQADDGFDERWSGDQPSLVPSRRSEASRDGLILRALKLAPDDPFLWWNLAMPDCPASAMICNRPRAIARLRELVPDNAAVWLVLDVGPSGRPSTASAVDAGDDIDERLQRGAEASHFDSYYAERMRIYLEAFEALPVPAELLLPVSDFMAHPTPQALRAIAAFGLHAAEALPVSRSLREACLWEARTPRRASELLDGRRALCLRAARNASTLADTSIDLSLASGLLLGLLPEGEERQRVEQTRRALEWQILAMGELMDEHGDTARGVEMLAERWRRPGCTELSLMRALLREHDVPLDPPASWRSWREADVAGSRVRSSP